ncbi:MAG: hypothetical protein IKN90_07275 [Treponema sp.]|nr:hypothetical protein [Treponema sp.]
MQQRKHDRHRRNSGVACTPASATHKKRKAAGETFCLERQVTQKAKRVRSVEF